MHCLKVSTPKIFINYKGENNKFRVEKPGRNFDLNQRITSNRTCECHEPYDMIH